SGGASVVESPVALASDGAGHALSAFTTTREHRVRGTLLTYDGPANAGLDAGLSPDDAGTDGGEDAGNDGGPIADANSDAHDAGSDAHDAGSDVHDAGADARPTDD